MKPTNRPKVVLYNPKAVFWTMPLALLAVGSALDREKYEVVIVDGRLDPPEKLFHHLEDALCLGVTVLTGAPLHDALTISREARKRRPDLPIIWGGWHPSLFPEMCASEEAVTAVVTGQGEETLAEIFECLVNGSSLGGVQGCAFSHEGQVMVNFPRPMRDINLFPRHDYSLIRVEEYFQHKGQRQFDYISSQGCRFRCNFCADPAVFNRGWHGYTPERMVGEISDLWRKYQFTDLSLQDETYFTHAKRVAAIAEGFLEEGLKFTWFGTMRADQGQRLDDEVFALCARSGLRRVMIGLEAGSQETIDWIQKDIKVEDMWETAEKLVRHNIGAIINVIVGFPGETAESVSETLRVAQELRSMSSDFELAVFYFKPYPGNPIADRLRAENYRFPQTLEEWADFDYIGSSNDWLSDEQKEEIEHFKFYQRFAYSGNRSLLRWPLQKLSRWRVERKMYAMPLEKTLIERLRPGQALS
jgi:radical SAM superfamily enzyme YgiQ (UPF0313 family)